MSEQTKPTELRLPAPPEAWALIEAMAKTRGWQPQVDDGTGTLVANPQQAHEVVFEMFLEFLRGPALNQLAAERYSQVRSQTADEVNAAIEAWSQAMKSN